MNVCVTDLIKTQMITASHLYIFYTTLLIKVIFTIHCFLQLCYLIQNS